MALALPGTASPVIETNSRPDHQEQWHLSALRVSDAHKISQGDGITVAVPDSGVSNHQDLQGNLLPGTDVIAGGKGDGHDDRDGHGTGMAGLIAAHGTGNEGALGIAPRAKILPILCSPAGRDGDTDALALAIEFAVTQGADVISISIVGGASIRLQQAITSALMADIVVIAAAGNSPGTQMVGYPARHPGVIAVGGIDRNGTRAAISVTGPEIDVVAPAVDIYSTSINGKYRKGTGTSDATAIVAGAAALIRSKYPYLPAQEVAHRLTATAIDKGPPGRDDEYGYGVIDLVAALTADVPPLGFESVSAPAGAGPTTTADARPGGGDDGATARGLATLAVIVAAGVGWALVARRRRRGDDPPPRISR
ncbi:type VII secretion-associated serine protease mycosin [Micromonospora sp. MH99]|uniref:type VII secretion-associated serine protease mycosin n=1 Tax=Micromonospora sp. MH99 TaxID=1945510 RepID=UPI001F2C88BF|nr:type VII secretion-associated serine protease mycosin [Micromonospora sp. MH99]MCF0095316.1 Subtilisin DY [Micromonospora sp. MH99]